MNERKERSLGELFGELTREIRTLFRQEVELARTETSEKISRASKDLISLAIGGVLLHTATLVLVAAAVIGLAAVIPAWLAALLIGLLFVAIGFAFVSKGRKDLARMKMKPERTAETLRETAQWAKSQIR